MTRDELLKAHAAGRRDFRGADLGWANLKGADLAGTDLKGADLVEVNLRGANLEGATLEGADLGWADLRGASLAGAYLAEANLTGANLTWTILDPDAQIPLVPDAEITAAGLEIDGDWVYGWRTVQSQVVGWQMYEPGRTYTAPWFSVCTTECHPGIYLSGRGWLERKYPDAKLVRVRCLRCNLHHAGSKWRAREIEVLEEENKCES